MNDRIFWRAIRLDQPRCGIRSESKEAVVQELESRGMRLQGRYYVDGDGEPRFTQPHKITITVCPECGHTRRVK